jgi:hypothetical protein
MNTDTTGQDSGLQFPYRDITLRIVGVFFGVYGELGYGFLESIYRAAMTPGFEGRPSVRSALTC